MTSNDNPGGRGFSLKRWSRRKLEASRPAAPVPPAERSAPGVAPHPGAADAAPPVAAPNPLSPAPTEPLPPVDSLSFDSDFTAFLRPEVDETLRRQALAKLFSDPRFNLMDGLDVYIDDYSKPDPIPPEMLRELAHCRSIFDPPRTRVNEQGFVEDVPPEEIAAAAQADAAAIGDAAPSNGPPNANDAPVASPSGAPANAPREARAAIEAGAPTTGRVATSEPVAVPLQTHDPKAKPPA